MLDPVTVERIKLLHPIVRKEVLDMYTHANEKLLPKGVRLRFAYTLRTNKEQDDLYAKGRTKAGRIITNAKGGQSIHNYGLAFDIVILFDEDGDGKFEIASYDLDSYWMKVTNYFKSKGWEWGGDWKSFKDYPHFQKVFGLKWQDLIKMAKDSNGYFAVKDVEVNDMGVSFKIIKPK